MRTNKKGNKNQPLLSGNAINSSNLESYSTMSDSDMITTTSNNNNSPSTGTGTGTNTGSRSNSPPTTIITTTTRTTNDDDDNRPVSLVRGMDKKMFYNKADIYEEALVGMTNNNSIMIGIDDSNDNNNNNNNNNKNKNDKKKNTNAMHNQERILINNYLNSDDAFVSASSSSSSSSSNPSPSSQQQQNLVSKFHKSSSSSMRKRGNSLDQNIEMKKDSSNNKGKGKGNLSTTTTTVPSSTSTAATEVFHRRGRSSSLNETDRYYHSTDNNNNNSNNHHNINKQDMSSTVPIPPSFHVHAHSHHAHSYTHSHSFGSGMPYTHHPHHHPHGPAIDIQIDHHNNKDSIGSNQYNYPFFARPVFGKLQSHLAPDIQYDMNTPRHNIVGHGHGHVGGHGGGHASSPKSPNNFFHHSDSYFHKTNNTNNTNTATTHNPINNNNNTNNLTGNLLQSPFNLTSSINKSGNDDGSYQSNQNQNQNQNDLLVGSNSGNMQDGSHHGEEPDFDPDFDTSSAHLMKIFNALDTNKDLVLSYDEMKQGIKSLRGLINVSDMAVDSLIVEIDDDQSGQITQEKFVKGIQRLVIKLSSQTDIERFYEAFVYDYSDEKAICRWLQPDYIQTESSVIGGGTITIKEITNKKEVLPAKNRWIGITGLDMKLILELAQRYNLHALEVEDVITQNKERPKVEVNENGSIQVVITHMSILDYDNDDTVKQSKNELPHLGKTQINIFLLEGNTVLSVQRNETAMNHALLDRILYAGSKIRQNDSRFLVYAILDGIIDEVFPIIKFLRRQLKILHAEVTSNERIRLKTIKSIQHLIREINILSLWLSPIAGVVNKLKHILCDPTNNEKSNKYFHKYKSSNFHQTDDNNNNNNNNKSDSDSKLRDKLAEDALNLQKSQDNIELTKYFGDLQDHIHALQEQCTVLIQWANSLNDECLNEQQYRMNQVMYILTLITTIFFPAQFFTGVFGMNFTNMPGLDWFYGYYMFWILIGVIAATIFFYFRKLGWV